jgi:Lon protease-like protein
MATSSAPPSTDFTAALAALPLFPLPEVALFPGELLPLHVFEPRYRAMVRDVLDSHRAIGVVQLDRAAPRDGSRPPAIAQVAGVGTIVDCSELPSGRFNIVLRGRARVALDELPFTPPYRRARATVLASVDDAPSSTEMSALLSTVTSFVGLVRARDASFAFRLPKDATAGALVDHCAQHLLVDGRDRQRALETLGVRDRVALVTEAIALQQLGLGGAEGGTLN